MARFQFGKKLTQQDMKKLLEKLLGPEFQIEIKKKLILVRQSAARGCSIKLIEKDGKTQCIGPNGYMPSGGLRLGVLFGGLALFFIIFYSMGYIFLGGGIPLLIVLLIMKAPSQQLVQSVSRILKKIENATSLESSSENIISDVRVLPEDYECPNCGVDLELEEDERKARKFTCPNCNTAVDLA